MRVELVGIARAAGAVEILGTGDQQLLDLAEAAHHQAAVVVEFGTHADGDVEAFVDDIDATVADVHLDADLRVLRQELRQQLRHRLLRDADRHADADDAARFRAEAIDHFARGLRFGEHRQGMAVDALADIGDRETARGPLQQAYAEVGLELADAPAQPRLGDPERAFGSGETAVVDDGGEVVEVVEVLHGDNPMNRTVGGIRAPLFHGGNGAHCVPTRHRRLPTSLT
jgi:hypothetical protein